MYNIIFPAAPGTNQVASFWEKEAKAAEAVGFGISTVTDHNDWGPLTITNKSNTHLYRGWVAKPQRYQEISLASPLLNSYEDYLWSFEFPRWYSSITEHTPHSFIYPAADIQTLGLEEIAKQISVQAGNKSLMIKDYLKSRKHEWTDACFIKDASDVADSIRIMSNFFSLQGRDFYGGLVFREFLSLKKLGTHPKSGMPLPVEFRTFFLNQKPLITSLYWNNDVEYPAGIENPPQVWLEEIGKKMRSPFVALDIAQAQDGQWWVIEVNDAGCAGYPDTLDPKTFFQLLFDNLNDYRM